MDLELLLFDMLFHSIRTTPYIKRLLNGQSLEIDIVGGIIQVRTWK